MSNYVQDQLEEEEQFKSNVASHSQTSNGCPETAPTDGSTPLKKKKRNLPGNPGNSRLYDCHCRSLCIVPIVCINPETLHGNKHCRP